MCEQEYQQAMLEREQQLHEALIRAEEGKASELDWQIIYFECGLKRKEK